MEILFYIYIFIIGTLFGSFASVIINRLKNKKAGILTGRSECPKCKHKLGVLDLIPIFSFLFSRGRCRYCKNKISFIYPILEISTGFLFFLSSYFLIDINLLFELNLIEIYKLIFFLTVAFLTIIYIFYDILYLEIPDSILAILIGITFITISLQSLIPNFSIINILPNFNSVFSLKEIIFLIFLSTIIIIGLYFIMLKGLKEIYDFFIITFIIFSLIITKFIFQIDLENTAIGNAILGRIFIFIFLFIQIVISSGTWMGGGDLRIGIFMGLLVGINLSFYAIIISYLFGSIVGILIIIYKKTRQYYKIKKSIIYKIKNILGIKQTKIDLNTKIPFGPFLAIGIYLILFFNIQINSFIEKLFKI